MAYKIDNVEGEYVVIDLATGSPASGAPRFRQRNFAEEQVRKLSEADKPAKRARTDEGHFVADDPETPEVNEAYVGGKAPKKKAKKKAPAKKKTAKKK